MSGKKPDKKILKFEEAYPVPLPVRKEITGWAGRDEFDDPVEPSDAGPKADLTDVDLYCLHCGYNLRGLSGDPRRCPECGQLSPLSQLTLPAQAITAQLRRMETWPTLCIGFVLLMMVLVGLVVCLLLFLDLSDVVSGCVYIVPVTAILIVLWSVGVGKFRSACLDKAGWSDVLIEYHLYGLGLCLTILLAPVLSLAYVCLDSRHYVWLIPLSAVTIIAGLLGVTLLAPRIHRNSKVKMDLLQREVAVKMAGEFLQRRLSRSRG